MRNGLTTCTKSVCHFSVFPPADLAMLPLLCTTKLYDREPEPASFRTIRRQPGTPPWKIFSSYERRWERAKTNPLRLPRLSRHLNILPAILDTLLQHPQPDLVRSSSSMIHPFDRSI